MSLTLTAEAIPTGRAVFLDMGYDTPAPSGIVLERRSTLNNTWETIYSGDAAPWFIDAGENQSVPLDAAYTYSYRLSDSAATSSVTVSGISVNKAVKIIEDPNEDTLIRLMEGAVNSLTPPDGFGKIKFLHALPRTGFPELPIITVNMDLGQQHSTAIGNAATPQLDPSVYVEVMQFRRYSFYVLAANPSERTYYRQAIVAICYNLANTFLKTGGSMEFDVQYTQGQTDGDRQDEIPGFFYAQIMLDITFQYRTTLENASGSTLLIKEIDTTPTPVQTIINK